MQVHQYHVGLERFGQGDRFVACGRFPYHLGIRQ
jgi:hypothetical protein